MSSKNKRVEIIPQWLPLTIRASAWFTSSRRLVLFFRGAPHSKFDLLDLSASVAKLRGNVIDLHQYMVRWGEETANTDVLSFRSERLPEGIYDRAVDSRREFAPGELLVNERDIERVENSQRYKMIVLRPSVISHFEVETRGRVVSLAPFQLPTGQTMSLSLIWR